MIFADSADCIFGYDPVAGSYVDHLGFRYLTANQVVDGEVCTVWGVSGSQWAVVSGYGGSSGSGNNGAKL